MWFPHDLRQDQVSVCALLFLDALDEFNSEPEAVVEFVKDLVRRLDSRSMNARVRISRDISTGGCAAIRE